MRGKRVAIAVGFLVIPVATLGGGQVSGPELFPIAKGARWEYTIQAAGKSSSVIATMVSSSRLGAETHAELHLVQAGRGEQVERYIVTAGQVGRSSTGVGGLTLYDPPLPVIRFPVVVGAKWDWVGSISFGGEKGAAVGSGKVGGLESVTTGAGTFKAFRIDLSVAQTMRGRVIQTSSSTWYAPKVGMVKMNMEMQAPNSKPAQTHSTLVRYKIK